MLKHLLAICSLLVASFAAHAQFTFSFDDLPLDSANYDYTRMVDTGDYYFDHTALPLSIRFFGRKESWGGFAGFTYSNMTDTTTQSFTNDKAAITGKGFNNSEKYAVFYGPGPGLKVAGGAYVSKVQVTNSTFSTLSMKNGDAFAKKFGGVSGDDPDYFLVTIYGYLNGQMKTDSVNFYLADFRSANNADDYIVSSWKEVSLLGLGIVDSLSFKFSSSDTGTFGINTPSYVCLDDIELIRPGSIATNSKIKLDFYPNPAGESLFIKKIDDWHEYGIYNVSGKLLLQGFTNGHIDLGALLPGYYFLKIRNKNIENGTATFIKK